jgi:Ca2+/Na+ antiporter
MRPILYNIVIGILYSVTIASFVGIIMGYKEWSTPIQYYKFPNQLFNPVRNDTMFIKRDQDDTFTKTLHILAVVYSIITVVVAFSERTNNLARIFLFILLMLIFIIFFFTNKLSNYDTVEDDSCKNDYYTNLKPLIPFNCERSQTNIYTGFVIILLVVIFMAMMILLSNNYWVYSKSVNKQLWYFGL